MTRTLEQMFPFDSLPCPRYGHNIIIIKHLRNTASAESILLLDHCCMYLAYQVRAVVLATKPRPPSSCKLEKGWKADHTGPRKLELVR